MRIFICCVLAATLLSACSGSGTTVPAISPTRTPFSIAVVGDSISKLAILPDSVIPCGAGYPIDCDYSTDGTDSYPTFLGLQTGGTILNLASPGCRTTEPYPNTTPVIAQVPSIPPTTNVVIWESGTNDTSEHGASSAYQTAIDTVASAIRAQAPDAKLIIIGVRYYNNAVPSRVDTWDAYEQQVAGATFVDTRPMFVAGVSVDYPDGTHPSFDQAVPALARRIETTLMERSL